METAIDYLTKKHKWKVSSDPRTYSDYPNNYGLRNYTEKGINYDKDCNGYHRAFDLYNNDTNDVPTVTHGTVIRATDKGSFGGEVLIEDYNGYIWVYGHLQRGKHKVKKGDKVRQGDIIGLQGNSNYYDNPMSVHLHLQLLAPKSNTTKGKWYCPGLQIDRYNINNGDYTPVQPKKKKIKHIYSSHINGRKITNKKTDIKGVVLHNDYGSMKPSEYLSWLYGRERNGTHVNGFASVYVDKDECLWYHPTDYVEWHCGNQWANNNLVGLEVCGSYPGHLSDKEFLKNEEATLMIASEILKSYNLPANRDTVRLHWEFFATSCPHRSWEIHIGKNAPYNKKNLNKMKDYFIKRIKHYMAGNEFIPSNNSNTAVRPKVEANTKAKANKDGWNRNQYGTYYKVEKATFKVGNQPIFARDVGPFTSNKSNGQVQPGQKIKYDEVMLQDGHVWIGYTLNNGKREYLPIRTWNGVAPNTKGYSVGALWGTIK